MLKISCARCGSSRILRGITVATGAWLALFLSAGPARAQAGAALSGRLPAGTIGYLEWRGTAFLSGSAAQNHVLQLLADPDVTAAEQALAAKATATPGAVPPALIFSLLKNPMLAGVTGPDRETAGKPAVFFVYDTTGQEALISLFMAARASRAKKAGPSKNYEFRGTTIEASPSGAGINYTAQTGGYLIYANQKSVIEDLVTRFQAGAASPGSLGQVAEYQEVQKYLGPHSAMELFVRVSALTELASADKNGAKLGQALQNLHLNRIHAAGWGVSFNGDATHSRGVVFGNTAPGSPFDVIGASTSTFATEPIAAGSASFAVSRFDWEAAYRLIRGVTPEQQAGSLTAFEGLAQGFLGMPLDDALSLFSGETARATSYSADGTAQSIVAISIRRPNDVLRIVRAVTATMTLAEDSSGATTFLDLAYPYRDPVTGMQRRKLYYIAVTPGMILAAPRKGALTKAAAQVASASAATTAASTAQATFGPDYAELRAQLPQRLSGLGAADWTRIPWDAFAASFVNQMQAATQHSSKNSHSPDLSFLRTIKLDAIPRHLHISVGGWWKDANGVYFESYLQ